MKKVKNNFSLQDKNRYAFLLKDKRKFLRNLTIRKSIKILEALTSIEALGVFPMSAFPHRPCCLRLSLKK